MVRAISVVSDMALYLQLNLIIPDGKTVPIMPADVARSVDTGTTISIDGLNSDGMLGKSRLPQALIVVSLA